MTDDVTLLPWAAILSALALFLAWRSWSAGDTRATVRRVGWALVPWALWLVGALRLVVRIGAAVADWAAGFVFRPSVWVGIGIGLLAVLLIAVGSRGKKGVGAASPAPSRPGRAAEGGGTRAVPTKPSGKSAAAGVDDDMAEIEEILRRRGIE